MKDLRVFDFDKTLIPYDSFNRYLKVLWRKVPIRVGVLLVLRVCRLISTDILKQRVTKIVDEDETLRQFSKDFCEVIARDIIWPEEKRDDAIIISASPACYMRYLTRIIHVPVYSSDYYEGKYLNLYGEIKQKLIDSNFPKDQYDYLFAISDSESDLIWMKKFKNYRLISSL